MELKVFPNPAVAGLLEKMVESRVHNDLQGTQKAVRDWQNELVNTFATPTYVLMDPNNEQLIAVHQGPEMDPVLFAEWLDEAYGKWEAKTD